jgi:DNA-directed RNA polymerase subunit RPC12/RpoP
MSIKTQYICDRCGYKSFNQFDFKEYSIRDKTEQYDGHLCDECRKRVLTVLKEKP